MTLRPTRTFRWAYPLLFVGLAVFFLWGSLQDLIHGTPPDAVPWWFSGVCAVPLIGMAVLSRASFIRVGDSTIVCGPWAVRRTMDRRDVAQIVGTPSLTTRRVLFLGSDGSTLWSTSGFVWGRAALQSLADYLGVPLKGAACIPSYWDLGRWC